MNQTDEKESFDLFLNFFDSPTANDLTHQLSNSVQYPNNENLFSEFKKQLKGILQGQRLNTSARLLVEDQFELRRKHSKKLGRCDLFITDRSAQQASSHLTAIFKQNWLKENCLDKKSIILDLCCGSGIDSIGMCEVAPVIAFDRDPTLVEFARRNLKTTNKANPFLVVCQDVESIFTGDSLSTIGTLKELLPNLPADVTRWAVENGLENHSLIWHIDPDRRQQGNRFTSVDHFSPSTEFVDQLIQRIPTGLLKLAPASNIPEHWKEDGDWTWIGHDRECKQLLGQFHSNSCGQKGVSVWSTGRQTWQTVFTGNSEGYNSKIVKQFPEPGDWILEPHSCYYAAGMSNCIQPNFQILGSFGNYLTARNSTLENLLENKDVKVLFGNHLQRFQVQSILPPKEKKILRYLKENQLKVQSVKKRSQNQDLYQRLERIRKHTDDATGGTCSLIILQVDKKVRVAVCC